MATHRDYSRAFDSQNTRTNSTRVTDRTQIHHALSEAGLNPSDYIFSPLPQDNSPKESTPNYPSAFSSYPSYPRQDNPEPLKPHSQSFFTPGRPVAYVQQPAPPPPPPPPPPAQSTAQLPAPYNQQQGPPPPPTASSSQQGPSILTSLFNSSQPPPQNTTSQPGPSVITNLFNPPQSNTQNITSQPPSDMNHHSFSPRRSPPPPPHCSSYHHDSTLSAQHYLHQIQSHENPPVRVVKPSTQNVVYKKEIRIRYLQPPTPPPPAPIIIREKRIPPRPPQSPLLIRERKPEARTPPPLTIRERPPTPPAPLQPHIIEKSLPPPPPQPRQIIVERLPTPPPKPRTVIFEKWLPYRKVKRPVLLQKAPPPEPIKVTRNVVIEYEPLKAFTVRRVIEEGVFRVDPHEYSSYNSQSHAGGGDIRIVERIEDLPPPSEHLLRVLNEYKVPVQPSGSGHSHSYDHYSHHCSSEHIPSNIHHLLAGARPSSNIDQLTNVSRASNTPAYRQERVYSPGYASSRASPVMVPLQRSYSKSSNRSSKHISRHASPLRSHIDDIY